MGNSLRRAVQCERWDEVRDILQSNDARNRARNKTYLVPDNNGGSALKEQISVLHLACRHRPPEDVVRMILNICGPSSAASAESFPSGEVPLHCAVRSGQGWTGGAAQHEAVVAALLEAHPPAVYKQSSPERGMQTPLHLACAVQSAPAVVRMLVDADPDAARELRDWEGRTAGDIAKSHSWLLSPRWRWKVSSIVDSSSSTAEGGDGSPSAPPMAASQVDDDVADGDACVVCWDGQANHVLVPCGHMCLCESCASGKGLRKLDRTCPVCKCKADRAMRVFRAGIPDADGEGGAIADATAPPPTAPSLY